MAIGSYVVGKVVRFSSATGHNAIEIDGTEHVDIPAITTCGSPRAGDFVLLYRRGVENLTIVGRIAAQR
jgi:hypothetical protein